MTGERRAAFTTERASAKLAEIANFSAQVANHLRVSERRLAEANISSWQSRTPAAMFQSKVRWLAGRVLPSNVTAPAKRFQSQDREGFDFLGRCTKL